MKTLKDDLKQDSIKLIINGKPITLLFSHEPNKEAAGFIKKTLIKAYTIKVS